MTIDEMISVLTEKKAGKQVQVQIHDEWIDEPNPSFDFSHVTYRIKPEPHYRPFKDAEEVMEAIKEHGDWVRFQNGGYYKITFFNKDTIRISDTGFDSYTTAFKDYKFIDETPFGKFEE